MKPMTHLVIAPQRRDAAQQKGRARRLSALAAALLMLALAAAAQGTTDRTDNGFLVREIKGSIPVSAPARLRIVSEAGNVTVHGAGAGALTYDIQMRLRASAPASRAALDAWPISVRRQRDLIVVAVGGGPRRARGGVRIDVAVPTLVRAVRVHAAVGNIVASGLSGEFRAETAAGNISADAIQGPVQVETAAGNVDLGHLASSVEAATAGGNIKLAEGGGSVSLESQGGNLQIGHAQGEVRAVTAGGSIHVESADGAVTAESAGGNIVLGRIGGAVRSETAGGNIRVARAASVQCQSGGGSLELKQVAGPVHATTEAGAILAQIVASSASFGPSLLQSGVGEITVYLPADLPVTLNVRIADAFGHRLISDFPRLRTASQPRDGELQVEEPLNGGGPLLRLISTSSNVTVDKLP